MRRRDFLNTGGKLALLGAIGGLPLDLFAGDYARKGQTLTILHTNDVHSRLDPFPEDGSKNAGLGGAARRAALIKQIRAEAEHVLLLDAGDIFQGTPYFNYFHGEAEFRAMSQMGYDAATLGNHDFDCGMESLEMVMPHAFFPFINCNYDFSNTALNNKIIPHKIFKKGDLKIGVLGVGIELDGLVPKSLYAETVYSDPVAAANKEAAILKKDYGCDYVICLSHLGYTYGDNSDKICDLKLAAQSRHIDLIIGGHTHTFLDKPTLVRNLDNQETLVTQVGWAGIMLGRIDVHFEHNRKALVSCTTCQNLTIGQPK